MANPVRQFDYTPAWGGITPTDGQDVIEFWLAEKALGQRPLVEQRLKQLVCLARDRADGSVAGVCTAVLQTPSLMAQPFYVYRSFVGRRWRDSRLVYNLFMQARKILEDYAIANDYPAIGILAELESPAFTRAGKLAVWPKVDLVYVGKSPRGLDVRVCYFRRAQLKRQQPQI